MTSAGPLALVVDDNPNILGLLSVMIQSLGHEVSTAVSGDEALLAIEARKPDLLLLDLNLPNMDGMGHVKYQPSAFFALQVVRVPRDGMITCAGGGYIASGAIEKSKLPLPVMPVGLKYVELEGAGEVQTPLVLPQDCPKLNLGDPVFFQHAKAGELCERFNELILIQGGGIVDTVKTYRGEGFAFL